MFFIFVFVITYANFLVARCSYNIRLLDDESYEILLNVVENDIIIPYSRTNVADRRISDMQRKFRFSMEERFNMVSGRLEMMLVVYINGAIRIYPRLSNQEAILGHFYVTYKGEGARKLLKRIQETYAGITREAVQNYINRNIKHCIQNPAFTNKPPLQPVVEHTVNNKHQIDLVTFEKNPQVVNGVLYKYVLSVIDVFSRYLFLRPTSSKEPPEIKDLLLNIYR